MVNPTKTWPSEAAPLTTNREMFLDAGARLVRDLGAEAVVLAGTDLGLVFDRAKTDYRVIDALDVHVDVLARLATGDLSLEDRPL